MMEMIGFENHNHRVLIMKMIRQKFI